MRSEQARPSATARGYGQRWQKARLGFLRNHPLCVWCAEAGLTVAATVVDHIEPHRGDQSKFWDDSNWMALCRTCHSSGKQAFEKSGRSTYRGCSTDGTPLDPKHPWHADGKRLLTPSKGA